MGGVNQTTYNRQLAAGGKPPPSVNLSSDKELVEHFTHAALEGMQVTRQT